MAVLYSDVLSDGLVLNVKLVDSGLPSMKELVQDAGNKSQHFTVWVQNYI